MEIDIKDLEQSYSVDPNIKLGEYLNLLKERQNIEKQKRIEQLNNRTQWYKDLIGRYFILNFNNISYTIIYIDKMFGNDYTTIFLAYNVYRTDKKFSIDKENRSINKLWLNCPYEDKYYGENNVKVKEITKEEFDSYEKLFETQKALFNALNL